MKLRNQLLALCCVAVFVGVCYLYVQRFVVQKPFEITLFVSDGLVSRQLTMARLYEGGAEHRLALETFPNVALLRNFANDFAVPDDAAAGTALATGQRVNHRVVGLDGRGQPSESLLALARAKGRKTGLVTNGSLSDPLPAAFYAHAADARETDALAAQLADRFELDVALGGGEAAFNSRKDQRNLLDELKKRGIDTISSKAELETLPSYHPSPVLGLFAPRALAFSNQIELGSRQPSLADMVRRAIVLLQGSGKGYVLVVDAALVSAAAERNEAERTIAETVALDQAVDAALKYAGAKSLIVAVGKHSIGGLTLNGYPLRQDRGVALLGPNAAGYPYLTWATGPNGPGAAPSASPSPARNEPAAYGLNSALNNAEDVLALGRGLGAERFRGFLDSKDVFEILKDAL